MLQMAHLALLGPDKGLWTGGNLLDIHLSLAGTGPQQDHQCPYQSKSSPTHSIS